MSSEDGYRCGYATLIGRPNVGKSTLLNELLGQRLSITSRKPQTTRGRLLGIKTDDCSQIIYIDTPGFQKHAGDTFKQYMHREILNALANVDVTLHVIEALKWTEMDDSVTAMIREMNSPVLLVVNKTDKIKDKKTLLPFISSITQKINYNDVIPVSAHKKDNLVILEDVIKLFLPRGIPLFPEGQITDKTERFFAAEFIREKLTRKLGDELPYQITVTIEEFNEKPDIIKINATIWVSTSGQKGIVIGKNGVILKSAGEEARKDMEKMFDKKVFLRTWVRIKKKWTSNTSTLKQLGYNI